jgi:hypothetical protein
MKRTLFFLLVGSALSVSVASAQTPLKGYTTVIPLHAPPANASTAALQAIISVPTPLPMWTYSMTASADLGGGTYSGTIIGHSPYLRGKAVTNIPTQIIPLVITITDSNGTFTYDPTAVDTPCIPGHTVVDTIAGSPVFTNNTSWTMNGVNVGTTQYEDANLRAEFWSLVSGSNYHLLLSETTLASQSLSFGTGGANGPGTNYPTSDFGLCDPLGVINIDDLDTAVNNIITGPLAGTINIGTFPIFLTKNVVAATKGTSVFSNCCVLGYHSAFNVGSNIQVYSPFSIDTAQAFGPGFTSALSHEIGEAIHDPNTGNPTPVWGNIGQDVGNCPGGQNNFEVGDPLSPGFGTPTNEWVVLGSNGLTYDLQELAFINWFYGGTSLGAGGGYSNHSTFKGDAKLCSAGGGTN